MFPFDLLVPPLVPIIAFFSFAQVEPETSEFKRSAEPPAPIELERQQIEVELAGFLHRQHIAFPPRDPEEARDAAMKQAIPTYSFYSDENIGGVLLSEKIVSFEGCMMVERLKRPDQTSGKLATVIEKRRHIAFLATDPPAIEVRLWTMSSPGKEVVINVPFQLDINVRLEALSKKADDILNEAYEKFPANVSERLAWLREQYNETLTDKVYLNASETTYHDSGTAVTTPLSSRQEFRVPRMQAERFIYLLDAYRTRFCDEKPAIDP